MTVSDTVLAPPADLQLPFEREIACLIAETLQLETPPQDIHPAEPLFVEGLGLDSIDALELALAISRRYGVEVKSDNSRLGEIFANLRSLSAHVDSCRII